MASSNRAAKEIHWQHLLEQFEQSGLSVRAFCAEKCIAANSLYQWRRKLKSSPESSKNTIIPVKLVSTQSESATSSRFVQMMTPNGFSIRFDSAMRSEELSAIIRVVSDSAGRGEIC